MKYRVATTNDFDEIILMKNAVKKRIENEKLPIWLNGYPLDSMIYDDIISNEARVVELDGEIIAYSAFHHAMKDYGKGVFSNDNVQCFGRIMVKDGFVGKHIGDFLITNLIEESKTLDVLGMGILADDCNIKAINLYKKHGFKKEGERQFPYAYLSILTLYFK